MLWRALALALIAPLSGASAQSIVDGSGKDLPGEQLNRIVRVVSDQMRDPESSRIRRVVRGTSDKLPSVCGEINSKNGLGAYAGYVAFIYFTDLSTANVFAQSFDDPKVKAEQDADLKEAGCPVH